MRFILFIILSLPAFALEFTILDEITSQPLKNTTIKIRRQNSIQCVIDPCPSNEMDYSRKTDQNGLFKIEEKNLLEDQKYLIIMSKDYNAIRLNQIKSNKLYITPSAITKDHRKLILVDYLTRKIIPNTQVKFCTDKVCENIIFKAKSNTRGILYYHYQTIFPKGLAQTEPVYLVIPNYKPYARYQHHRGDAMFDR
jgi:hypothetical protein